MKLHEYQAKKILAEAGLPVPKGAPATSVNEVVATAEALTYPVAIKAQVHAGGRGKAGGVKIAANREEAKQAAQSILGMELATAQTGTHGLRVERVLVEKGAAIEKEFYLSILPDRASGNIVIIVSRSGGMDIEKVATSTPEKIIRIQVDPLGGLQSYHLRRAAFGLELTGEQFKTFCALLQKLYTLVVKKDLVLAEINPLILTTEGNFLLLDAKLEVDSSALFRQAEIAALRNPAEEDPLEAEAAQYNLNYIRLDGNVGNMVNGAGLAMATMDMIKLAGAEPANFLDVGGGANARMIENGFRILLSDPKVKAILINIFGGILRCDVLAEGVVEAAGKVGLQIPVVVRMEGTNVEVGRKILAASGLDLITAVDLQDAAEKIAQVTTS